MNEVIKRDEKIDEKSVKSIGQVAEELKLKIAAAKQAKEEDIEKKLGERESLIEEQRINDGLVVEAQNNLNYFDSLDQSSLDLLDEDSKNQLEEVRDMVTKLEEQRKNIGDRIQAISEVPEVLNKLRDEADKENDEFGKNKEKNEKQEKSIKETDGWLDEVNLLVEKKKKFNDLYNRNFKDRNSYSEIQTLFQTAKDMAKNKVTDLFNISFDVDKRIKENNFDYVKELDDIKSTLGILDFKDKSAIKYLLDNQGTIDKCVKEIKEYRDLEVEIEKDRKDLLDKYRSIVKNAPDSYKIWEKVSDYGDANLGSKYVIDDIKSDRSS